jgi:hypothetical protein
MPRRFENNDIASVAAFTDPKSACDNELAGKE